MPIITCPKSATSIYRTGSSFNPKWMASNQQCVTTNCSKSPVDRIVTQTLWSHTDEGRCHTGRAYPGHRKQRGAPGDLQEQQDATSQRHSPGLGNSKLYNDSWEGQVSAKCSLPQEFVYKMCPAWPKSEQEPWLQYIQDMRRVKFMFFCSNQCFQGICVILCI